MNKILNQNDYKLEIKEKEKPKQKQKLASINPKNKKNEEEIIKKNNFSKEGEEKNWIIRNSIPTKKFFCKNHERAMT